jgi:hypothetical protein
MHKYGLINFFLVILELTEKELLIKKEQYFLEKYPYNVLNLASSLKYYKHSILTRKK